MKYLEVGKIVTTHGIKGEVKVKVVTDDISRFDKGNVLYVGDKHEKIVVDNYRVQKDMILLSFNDIKDINLVLKYVGLTIYVDLDEVRQDDEIYYDDLIDCEVFVNGKKVGIVVDVMEVPQGSILRIEKENGKLALVPYVDEFIVDVDIDNKKIIVDPIEGLL